MEEKGALTEFKKFLSLHKGQLTSSAIPNIFWYTLFKKFETPTTFDAGEVFQIVQWEDETDDKNSSNFHVIVSKPDGIQMLDQQQIYLIDHAWTYRGGVAFHCLCKYPQLVDRMCNMMNIDINQENSVKINSVYAAMWKYNQTYSVKDGEIEDQTPIWYIMDEFGSAIQHSDQPSFRTVPFYYATEGSMYTLLFPIKDIAYNEEVTRDFVEGALAQDVGMRRALLIPWQPLDLSHLSWEQVEPDETYFMEGRVAETLPNPNIIPSPSNKVLKVFSAYSLINNHLTDPNFAFTADSDEADILWLTAHFINYEEFQTRYPNKYINQFPSENILTIKDLLAIVCRRTAAVDPTKADAFSTAPTWLPTTFNLKTELSQFVSYFQQREQNGFDNHWICKPWNLARGLDIHITSNLNEILRLPYSGPKIAQKYIENPVLFDRPEVGKVKFDIRYVILLKSTKPLRAYAYKNFFLRFSNIPFELKDFHLYQKHFTVMNYEDNNEVQLYKMLCSDFRVEFEKQHLFKYELVEQKIFALLKEMFEASIMKEPPCGIGDSPQSRSMYAADLMLSWDLNKSEMEPKLLEVNWMPDCKRACEYYPNFYNDIFLLLFKNNENEEIFQKL